MAQDKYYFSNVQSPIKDLPDTKIEQILEDYGNYIKFDDIRLSFPEIDKSSFYNQLPFTLSNEKCENCSRLIYQRYKHNNYTNLHIEDLLCLNCGHNYKYDCECKICKEKRKVQKDEQESAFIKIWAEYYNKFYNLIYTLDDLTVFDEIYLMSIIDRFYDDYQDCLYFSKSANHHFNNFQHFENHLLHQDYTIIEVLIDRKILIPSKQYLVNNSSYFDFNIMPTIDIREMRWSVNIYLDKVEKEFYSIQSLNAELKLKQFSAEEKKQLFREVYNSEIEQYINSLSKKYIGIFINEMIINYTVELLLPRFSLSKSFALIFYSMSATMRYKATYNTNEQKLNSHFKNRISESILKNEFSKTLKDFNRPNDLELNFFSEYILDNILNQRTSYFYLSASKIVDANF